MAAITPSLAPIRASPDRLFDITVCLRPFRAAGPRLDTEMLGDTLVVHNYGHGGSGWSLSWGSSTLAVQKAMINSPRDIAVIGCGALGLTSAILAQRAGARVTIYAKEFLPQTRSARATGSWTPDSRIALTHAAGPDFPALWEQMARLSFKTYRNYLGLPGEPVMFTDWYSPSAIARDNPHRPEPAPDPLGFASYHARIADLTPKPELLPEGSTPFAMPFVYRSEAMTFNIACYGHTLMNDFMTAGGRMQHWEFHTPADIAALREKTVINCPGFGARALWADQSVTPVRGQIGWLIPQDEVRYAVYYDNVGVLSRRDGIVVQALDGGDMKGYGDAREVPDRAESERAVGKIALLYQRKFKGREGLLF
jgi:glycine/D-amino acid oxidase-like deaminating enzyme